MSKVIFRFKLDYNTGYNTRCVGILKKLSKDYGQEIEESDYHSFEPYNATELDDFESSIDDIKIYDIVFNKEETEKYIL